MRIALWVVQVLLAVMFAAVGFMKLTTPVEQLHQTMAWTTSVPTALVRFIGASELAGGIGLVAPAITRIAPMLTPLAGVGLAAIMVLASLFHVSRGEIQAVPVTLVLGALALFIAWGRTRKAPILAR